MVRRWGTGVAITTAACAPDARLEDERESILRVAAGPPVLHLLDPPAGSEDVASNLAHVVVRAPRRLRPPGAGAGLRFVPPVTVAGWEHVPCAGTGACYRVTLGEELRPEAYRIEVTPGLQFEEGGAVTAGPLAAFRGSGQPDRVAPEVTDLMVEDVAGCLRVRLRSDEPALVTLWLGGERGTVGVARGGPWRELDVWLPGAEIPPEAALEVTAEVVDRAGNSGRAGPVRLSRPVDLPPLVITEVLANPAGPESTQETVELRNLGRHPVGLGGLGIADAGGMDPLPPVELPPGGFALIVPAGYDETAPGDVPARPGTLVVRVDTRLGKDGLGNAGEVVSLRRIADGAVISRYGGWVDVSGTPGRSVQRVPSEACDERWAWSARPEAPTPGW